MQYSEAILLCRRGNPAGQKYVFDLYAEAMYTLCYRYVKNREDAEELMSNGFLSFFKSIHQFQDRGINSALPWLKKIMVNECLMYLRKQKKIHLVPVMEDSEFKMDANIISRLSANELYLSILQLPLGYRTIFNLFVIEGMSHHEIARELHISTGTSKSQLNKARKMLQSIITRNDRIDLSRSR